MAIPDAAGRPPCGWSWVTPASQPVSYYAQGVSNADSGGHQCAQSIDTQADDSRPPMPTQAPFTRTSAPAPSLGSAWLAAELDKTVIDSVEALNADSGGHHELMTQMGDAYDN